MKTLNLPVIRNKKNGQINVNLPRKKIQEILDVDKIRHVKVKIEGWD